MGEPLYEEVVGPDKLDRPCRIYAPVGTHETLLAYLVRRLLENGANSSFVNRIADAAVPVEELVADPVAEARGARRPRARPHRRASPLPRDLFADRAANSAGLDLSDEARARGLSAALRWTRASRCGAARRMLAGRRRGRARRGAGRATPPTAATSSATCVDADARRRWTRALAAAEAARRRLGRDARRPTRAALPGARRRR